MSSLSMHAIYCDSTRSLGRTYRPAPTVPSSPQFRVRSPPSPAGRLHRPGPDPLRALTGRRIPWPFKGGRLLIPSRHQISLPQKSARGLAISRPLLPSSSHPGPGNAPRQSSARHGKKSSSRSRAKVEERIGHPPRPCPARGWARSGH
jgi:hypothetical protein